MLDALNTLNTEEVGCHARDAESLRGPTAGNATASREGVAALAAACGLAPAALARRAVDDALAQIRLAAGDLIDRINAGPVYTLAALKTAREVRPDRLLLVGGPADCIRERLGAALSLRWKVPRTRL